MQYDDAEVDDNYQAVSQPVVLELKTNRRKAIIFINLYCICAFAYGVVTKFSINKHNVNALDVCLIRTFCMIVSSVILVLVMRVSIRIEEKDRWMLLFRSLLGTIGFSFNCFGIAMVPLTIQSTIFNTGPIFASILGCVFLKEIISYFEIVALVLSFGAVICIAFSKDEKEAVTTVAETENN